MLKKYPFIVILFLLPLLFININDSHDWGDDFAQYLIQARNLVEGKPQTENGLVFDKFSEKFAVEAYPIGFPLLISPVYALSEMEIRPYLILGTIFLILLAWLCRNYLCIFFGEKLSLLLMLFFAYHTLTLDLKAQILSEIPFTLFLLLIVLKLKNENNSIRQWLILGALAGFLSSIRIVGILCIPALAGFLLMNFIKNKSDASYSTGTRTKIFLLFNVACIGSFWILNNVLFKIPLFEFLNFYKQATSGNAIHFFSNLHAYLDQCGTIFSLPYLQSSWWAIICSLLILTGFINAFIRNSGFEEWWTLFYLIVLGLYPYTSGGFRFLFPLFPFLIRYFFEGIRIIVSTIKKSSVQKVQYLSCLILLVALIQPLYGIINDGGKSIQGPQSKEAKELFSYIRNSTNEDALIVFPRARAMALYSDRQTTYLLQNETIRESVDLFDRLKVSHLILPKDNENSPLYDPALWEYFHSQKLRTKMVWENQGFEVYRLLH
ncbi:MAG: glycosyltransferase family 39 protein [Bacteroidia bacterium]|nr:glycosyltransferase family 39 protein [Bacteroidia bacterium]